MRHRWAQVRGFYGASPLHLLTLIACFCLAGYAALHTAADSRWPLMLVWFIGAVIGHDLILFPLYAFADRSLKTAVDAVLIRHHPTRLLVSPLNYLRTPALGAALTFLLFFPGIIRQGGATYLAATGQTQQPFLARWLLLTAAMFGISALLYSGRLGRARLSTPHSRKASEQVEQ